MRLISIHLPSGCDYFWDAHSLTWVKTLWMVFCVAEQNHFLLVFILIVAWERGHLNSKKEDQEWPKSGSKHQETAWQGKKCKICSLKGEGKKNARTPDPWHPRVQANDKNGKRWWHHTINSALCVKCYAGCWKILLQNFKTCKGW